MSYDEPGMNFGGYLILRNGEPQVEGEGESRSVTWHDQSEWSLEAGEWE